MKRNSILVPVSVNQLDMAGKALNEAREMLSEGGTITVLNSHEPIPGPARHYLDKGAIKDRDAEISNILREFVGEDPRCKIELVSGRAGVTIVEFARTHSVDCIIISSHRPDLSDYLLGSTASRVVRHAQCSVFVLR
ncbi:universal stress protein [uncultured Tateyamaria sp.]|uniref:universal stress protein n=1 Tax=uncultured Tateyamaria sp. TaxID=455651 RepID=UPI00260E9B4B|nr:universal stress protein [uncultured Tateyamaria sp.]